MSLRCIVVDLKPFPYFVGGETEIIFLSIIAIMYATCPEYHNWSYKLIL